MITYAKHEEARPICSHCKKEITVVWYQELKGDLGKRCLYFCPECRSILGVSHRKGLTFGG
jgi:hypothetical protein